MAVDVPASSSDADRRLKVAEERVANQSPMAMEAGGRRGQQNDVTRVVTPTISVRQRLREIWLSRELLIYLVRTEIKVKYKNSALGLIWSMVAPAMTLAIYFVVFQLILGNKMPDFVIFLFAGLLLWNLFPLGVLTGTGVVVNNAGIVKKVSFPARSWPWRRWGRPACSSSSSPSSWSSSWSSCTRHRTWPTSRCCCWPCWPASCWPAPSRVLLSAINVYLRDTQHLIEVILTAWFWACPIVYPYQQQIGNKLGPRLTWVYFLNPMVPLVLTFQRCIYAQAGTHVASNGVHDLLRPARQGHALVRRARSRGAGRWVWSCSSSPWPCSAGSRATSPRSSR